jgi:hypothetical protein
MERWLFLQNEKKDRIREFSEKLEEKLGNYWDFSEFVDYQVARESLPEYNLEKCFKQNRKLEDVKLVIGQKFFGGPKIRFAFRYGKIWSDFLAPETPANYLKTKNVFQEVFQFELENYPGQQVFL